MLPSFISMEQAGKILAIGKNINFLKEICNNADEFQGRCEIKALLETGEGKCLIHNYFFIRIRLIFQCSLIIGIFQLKVCFGVKIARSSTQSKCRIKPHLRKY